MTSPALPTPTHYSRRVTLAGAGIFPPPMNISGQHMPKLSENSQRFSDAEANRKRISDLLWLAFPGCKSAREVQMRAAVFLGRDERTIRYWMEGTTGGPRWDEFAMLGSLVGFEAFLAVVYGRR